MEFENGNIGAVIKRKREIMGLSQDELAAGIVPRLALVRLESNQVFLPMLAIERLLSKLDIDELVSLDGIAYEVAGYAVDTGMINTQLRSFFEAIKKLQRNKEWKDIKPELILLKPRMAVRVGRSKVEEGFFKVIVSAMDKIEVDDEKQTIENFNVFVEFFEAIIAYHKYLGGSSV